MDRLKALTKAANGFELAELDLSLRGAGLLGGDKQWGVTDLGMEAIYEFDVVDMPVTVAVDSSGESVHKTGPREWQARIGKIPVVVE